MTSASRNPALGLGLLMLCTFTAITSESMPVGLLQPMSRDIGVSDATMGLLVSAYAIVVAVLAVPLTLATTRLSRKLLLLGTLAGYALGNLIIAIAPNFALLVVGRAVGGVAHAVFFAVISGYAIQLVPPRLAGRAVAIAFAGSSLGFALGVPLGTSLGDAVGWRVSFELLGGFAVLLLILASILLPAVSGETHPEGLGSGDSSRRRLWRTGFLTVGAANALVFLGHYVAYTYISPLMTRSGIASSSLGLIFLVLGVSGIVGLLCAGLIIDRRPRIGLLAAIVLMAIGLGMLVVASTSPALSITGAAVWAFGFGTIPTFFMSAAIRTKAVTADLAGAMVNSTSNLGIALGSLLGAQVFAVAGTSGLPPLAGVLIVAALVITLVARRGFPSRAPGHETGIIEAITQSLPVITRPIQVQKPR